jgi:dTDP-4-amino-4,6-dideoxygalactose transaminase
MIGPREVPFARPIVDDVDREAVLRVLHGHILTHGPECKAFEAEFAAFMRAGATPNGPAPSPPAHAVSVSSCMAALHLSYLHLGLGPGDEVIVPAQTHVATVHAVEWVGARPVFVDCELSDGNVSVDAIERALSPRTKAIGIVHFCGIPCDVRPIVALAREKGLAVVEDCATAIGARIDGVHVGLFGDMGCFSFYPVKHMTTGEGGMFVSKDEAVAARVARIRAFGVDRSHSERTVPGVYDVPMLGLNYRMSELSAALGRTQLAKLGDLLGRRRENFQRLRNALSEIEGVRVLDVAAPGAIHSYYCVVAVLDGALGRKRAEIIAKINARGVGTSVYYPQPVNRMTFYREKYGWDPAKFPNAVKLSDESIALPCGPHLGSEDMDYVAEVVRSAIREVRG